MSETPTVSILTTCYNRESYLGDAIESVLNGSFQSFELWIVDDQSTDDSVNIAKAYAAKDDRIHVHVNPSNLGDYPNRNHAATLARGEYIKYLDADDMLGKWALEMMVDAMHRYPNAGFGLFDFGPNRPLHPVELQGSAIFEAHYSGRHDFFHRSPLSAIIKRTAFLESGMFSTERYVGDFEMWNRMARTHPMVMISPWPLFWREHDQQESTDIRQDPLIPLRYQLLTETILADEATPLSKSMRTELLAAAKRRTARNIITSIKRLGPTQTLRMKKATMKSWSTIWKDAFS